MDCARARIIAQDPHPITLSTRWRDQFPSDKHPLDILQEKQFLNAQELGAAWFLIRLRNTALMRLDVARMGQVLKDIAREGLSDTQLTDGDYIYILGHCLSSDQRAIIERICWK